MPFYDIQHMCPLSDDQKDALAEAVTVHHTQKLTAPRILVNVRFTDVSAQAMYGAGRRRTTNCIMANVRHGPSRTQEMYDELCAEIMKSWNEIVGGGTTTTSSLLKSSGSNGSSTNRSSGDDTELRAIFVLGSIVAGVEAGFPVPQAGKDKEWLRENMAAFEERAKAGDEDFVELVREVRERKEFGMN